jgi:hypothetical protein
MSAIGQGFGAIAYLDADNWFSPEHIASLAALHKETGAAVCTSSRNLHRPDGTLLMPCPESDGSTFADTSCIFLARPAFKVAAFWALMDPKLHAIGDRIIMRRVRRSKLKTAFSGQPTVAYRTTFPRHYELAGESPPPEAKESTDDSMAAYRHLIAKGGPDLRIRFRNKKKRTRQKKRARRRKRRAWRK